MNEPIKGVAWETKVALFLNGAIVKTPTIAAGDFKISKDGGALANLATLPSEGPSGSGIVLVALSGSEMNADDVVIVAEDPDTTWDPFVIHLKPSIRHDTDGTPHANVTKIDGLAEAAEKLSASTSLIYKGSVTGATPTTTTLVDSGLTQSGNDHWLGRVVIFLTGALKFQATNITDFAAGTDTLTFVALSAAPSQGDEYIIV